MATNAMSVPASTQGESDPIVDSLLKTITTPIDPNLVKAAVTPTQGPRTTQVPSSLQRPIEPIQPGTMDNRPVVGRGNARAQGIGNAITGVMNNVGIFVTRERQQKQDTLRDASVKVIQSQQAIDEATRQREVAKASGDTNGMAAAQKIIDQNEAVRDGVFADPKLRKGLAKGFNINYTDPQSNDSEEHKAVMAGIKQAQTAQQKKELIQQARQQQNQQAGKALGSAYAQQQPTTFQANTEAQQKLQFEQANRSASQVALKDYLTFKSSMAHANATIEAAQIRAIGAGILQQTKFDQAQELLDKRFAQSKVMQDTRYKDALGEIAARGAQARQTARDIFSDRQSDPIMLGEKMQKSIKTYDDAIKADAIKLAELQSARTAMYMDPATNKPRGKQPEPGDVQAADQAIQYVKQHMQNMQSSHDSLLKNYNTLRSTYGATGGEGGSDAADSTTDTDTGDYSDPLNYTNAPGSDDNQ